PPARPSPATPTPHLPSQPQSSHPAAAHPAPSPPRSPSPHPTPSPALVGTTMTATWYRTVTDCNQTQGACAYALAVEPLFSDGTDHGIGPVAGACGSIRIVGTQPNGWPVDDTYPGCTVKPPPSWTGRSVPA